MAKYVPDLSTRRWVIISESRTARFQEAKASPVDLEKVGAQKLCVFCPGMEHTNYELFRLGKGGQNSAGWRVRVVANKYPITDFHEVIIHTPEDDKDIPKMNQEELEDLLKTYRLRYQANQEHGHVLIFCNHGAEAGASIAHPHSQLVVIPQQIELDTLAIERKVNVVHEGKQFDVYCPDFSQWPFETWITPVQRNRYFGQVTDEEIAELGAVLKKTISTLVNVLEAQTRQPGVPKVEWQKEVAYNYYIFHGQDWYLRLIPRLVYRAGLELGTGLSVNMVDPTDAARILKAEFEKMAP